MAATNGKSVIVTGSGRGIGRAIALRLAGDGFGVIINDFDPEPAALVVAEIQAAGGTHVHNTSEVGHIRVVGHESTGRINKRLRIEVDA